MTSSAESPTASSARSPAEAKPSLNLWEKARSLLDRDFLETLEGMVGIKKPDESFRTSLIFCAAGFLGYSPILSVATQRRQKRDAMEYLEDVLNRCRALAELLPHPGSDERQVPSSLVRAAARAAGEPGRTMSTDHLISLSVEIEALADQIEHEMLELKKLKDGPNTHLIAVDFLIAELAAIFSEHAGKQPLDHIRTNTAKDVYSGEFFYFVEAFMKQLGTRRPVSAAALGKRIKDQLRSHKGFASRRM